MKIRQRKKQFYRKFYFDYKNRTLWWRMKFSFKDVGHFWAGTYFN